ncbi:MAG: hypothetical protein JJ992_24030 [Planctomycetes bacterium]|nr:hypothetical protein [Planctomycetota bacterium]
MSKAQFTQTELEAYLDETLDVERMVQIEQVLRDEPRLLEHLARINARRDTGMHSIADIWRRHQIGVPSRDELGSFLLGVLSKEHADYIRFRVETLKCRFTIANLRDLQDQQQQSEGQMTARRRKYFQSSVGRLKDLD